MKKVNNLKICSNQNINQNPYIYLFIFNEQEQTKTLIGSKVHFFYSVSNK